MSNFVYMLTLSEEGIQKHGASSWSPHIGWTTNPIRRLNEQNRRKGYRTGHKTTQRGAPYWQFELVFGGLSSGMNKFRDDWRANSRKLERRIIYGLQYAINLRSANIVVYARDPDKVREIVTKLMSPAVDTGPAV